MTVTKIYRVAAGDLDAGQPELWTFIEFDVEADQAGELAQALSLVLKEAGGWYCHFCSPEEMVVVFRSRVFRYLRGDRDERAKVEEYARKAGVPEAQIDWPE